MLKNDAIANVKLHLGFRSNLDSEILTQLQTAQSTFEREGVPIPNSAATFLPWFLITEIADVLVAVGEERIALPSDFLAEWEDSSLWRYDASAADADKWTQLMKDDVKTARVTSIGSTAPKLFARSGSYFRIFPVPTEITTFKMIYYAAATALGSANTENSWLKYIPNLLIGEAGFHIASATRNASAIAIFTHMKDMAAKNLWIKNEEQEHVNRRYVMGGIED